MQDLTPQLRTRLSRVERAVGCFVLIATLLLATGFSYYIYHTAKRKGWFDIKVSYCTTLPYSAAGLRVGDPVKLMGFDVGEITRIDTQPPEDIFNVYVEFRIRSPYFGYLWTEGSRARVLPSDFMGNRILEVTKGTNGVPTHLTWEIREYTVRDALEFPEPHRKAFLNAFSFPDQTNNIVPLQPIDRDHLQRLAEAGIERVKVVDRAAETKQVTAVWSVISNCYLPYSPKTKPYWLPPDEAPALTERLDTMLQEIDRNLPSFFAMTNQLTEILTNAALLTAHADQLLVQSQPLLTNLTAISAILTNAEGSLGRWLLPPDLYAQTLTTLSNANETLTNASATLTNASAMLVTANTNLGALIAQLEQPLQNLSTIISNLNLQVQANTNFVTTLHALVAHTDDLIQGLKRHWLFRGAFKEKPTNPPPAKPTTPQSRDSKGATRMQQLTR